MLASGTSDSHCSGRRPTLQSSAETPTGCVLSVASSVLPLLIYYSQVLLLGQSAGALSIGMHLQANGGRDEGLFSAVLLLSGTPGFAALPPAHPRLTATYTNLTSAVGCPTSGADSLSCLRAVDATKLSTAMDIIEGNFAQAPLAGGLAWEPTLDGFFQPNRGSVTIKAGRIIDVPIVAGALGSSCCRSRC